MVTAFMVCRPLVMLGWHSGLGWLILLLLPTCSHERPILPVP
jgi:hypothetical protein